MEHDFFGRQSSGKFPGSTENQKRQSCFSGLNIPNSLQSSTSKPSSIPVSGLRGRFPVNGTDLYKMVNAIPGRNLPVLNFANQLPNKTVD